MRRSLVVLGLAAAFVVLASPAGATPPAKGTFNSEAENVLAGACPFDIRVVSVVSGRYTAFVNNEGVLARVEQHVLEQDTFFANGKSLATLPYAFNLTVRFDASGNVAGLVSSGGGAFKVLLPDGTFFHTAGRIDFYAHGLPGFWLAPDHGSMVNLEGFCAALAP